MSSHATCPRPPRGGWLASVRTSAGTANGVTTPDPLDGLRGLLHDAYGIEAATAVSLGGDVDRNLRVVAADGRAHLVKVGPAGQEWQAVVLDHVAATDPSLPVPRLVRARDGSLQVNAGDGQVVRVQSWLPGRMVASAGPPARDQLVETGRLAARVALALEGLPPSAVPATHYWDLRRADEAVAVSVGSVDDGVRRDHVARIMEAFGTALPRLCALPGAVVHQDLNDFNLLVESTPEGGQRLTGVLDFGDTLSSVRVAELIVAAAYAVLRQPDAVGALASVVAGWRSLAPLSDAEIEVVLPVAAARLCVNATTWTRRTSGNDDEYGRERMRHTWPAIAQLAGVHPARALDRLRSEQA